MRLAIALAASSVVIGCAEEAARPIRLNMVARTSCGTGSQPSQQNASCIKSLVMRVVDENREVLDSQCTPVAALTLDSLWRADIFTRVLSEVKARKNVYIEMRAYQARDRSPCDIRSTHTDLMLWGSSGLVDLTDPGLEVVSITYECRPDCMCDALGTAECPFALQQGVCSPPANLGCFISRQCDDRSECLGGALECSDGFCLANEGGFCAACSPSCDSGLCIVNLERCEEFCSLSCPGSDLLQCPDDTSCKRLGSADFQLPEDPLQCP